MIMTTLPDIVDCFVVAESLRDYANGLTQLQS